MTTLSAILLIGGAMVFVASFIMPEMGSELDEVDPGLTKKQLDALIEKEMKDVRSQVADIVEETRNYSVEKTERALERLTNEKISAVSEYSDTVLDDIHKSHEEVMFLYDMLNNKHEDLKETASRVSASVKEAKVAEEALSSAAREVFEKEQTASAEPEDTGTAPSEDEGWIDFHSEEARAFFAQHEEKETPTMDAIRASFQPMTFGKVTEEEEGRIYGSVPETEEEAYEETEEESYEETEALLSQDDSVFADNDTDDGEDSADKALAGGEAEEELIDSLLSDSDALVSDSDAEFAEGVDQTDMIGADLPDAAEDMAEEAMIDSLLSDDGALLADSTAQKEAGDAQFADGAMQYADAAQEEGNLTEALEATIDEILGVDGGDAVSGKPSKKREVSEEERRMDAALAALTGSTEELQVIGMENLNAAKEESTTALENAAASAKEAEVALENESVVSDAAAGATALANDASMEGSAQKAAFSQLTESITAIMAAGPEVGDEPKALEQEAADALLPEKKTRTAKSGSKSTAAKSGEKEADAKEGAAKGKKKSASGKKKKERPGDIALQFSMDGADSSNHNERILELHKKGKSNIQIARELGLGVGEVKLVLDLFGGM